MNAGEENRAAAQGRRSWSDLIPRLLSALVLIPVTALALFLGGVWLALLVGIVFGGVYREWETMIQGRRPGWVGSFLAGLVALSSVAFPAGGVGATLLIGGVGVAAGLVAGDAPRLWRVAGQILFTLVIISVLSVRGDSSAGLFAGLFLGVTVWMTDSSAFFAGRQIGGAKLSPDISPSKTWSGALGGLVAGTIGGSIVWAFSTSSSLWIGIGLAILLSIVGQLGDLAESAVKRRFRIKDSGDIIPGHGGLMDRLDSLTLAAIVMAAIGAWHAGAGRVAEGFLFW